MHIQLGNRVDVLAERARHCLSANKTIISYIPSTKPERISTNNMLLSVLVVVILTVTSYYAANGRVFTLGYVSSNVYEENELRGPAISIAIESFQANGWLQEHEIK